jgi:hypothetical protein
LYFHSLAPDASMLEWHKNRYNSRLRMMIELIGGFKSSGVYVSWPQTKWFAKAC